MNRHCRRCALRATRSSPAIAATSIMSERPGLPLCGPCRLASHSLTWLRASDVVRALARRRCDQPPLVRAARPPNADSSISDAGSPRSSRRRGWRRCGPDGRSAGARVLGSGHRRRGVTDAFRFGARYRVISRPQWNLRQNPWGTWPIYVSFSSAGAGTPAY